jgi:MFS transporter, DHA1 family, multidrug resistance protein
MAKIPPESVFFTILLAAIGTLPPFSIDMALPALSQIAESMHTSYGSTALTLSVFMGGFSAAQLLFGPLSDRYGRRLMLLVGCILFTLASFACAFAQNIESLLAARFLAGCGAGAGMVLVFAIVRDLFDGIRGRTKLSYVTLVVSVAPMIAPIIGALILEIADWRVIYAILGTGGGILTVFIYFGLLESLRNKNPNALKFMNILKSYLRVLGHREACAYVLINGLSFGCMFAYVTGSSFAMMHIYGLSAHHFSLAFGSTALSILTGAYVSGKLSERHVSEHILLTFGLLVSAIGGITLAMLVYTGNINFSMFLMLCVVTTFGYGVIAPNAAHGAMHPMPEIAGIAGATLGFFQMAGASLASAAVASFSDNTTAFAMTGTMASFAFVALAVYFFAIAVPLATRKATDAST